MRLSVTLLCICMCCSLAFAQKQNNTWYFGYKNGISFNSSPPAPLLTTAEQSENGATVSDATTGDFLFYTNGMKVWDKNGYVMPNSYNLGDDQVISATQGSVIVPRPHNPGHYYIVMVGTGDEPDKMKYAEVDMSLRSGMGDVLIANKSTVLGSGYTEAITAVSGCGNTWVLGLKMGTNEVHAFKVEAAGITGPVISKVYYPAGFSGYNSIKISPDKKSLAVAVFDHAPNYSYLALYDFSMATANALTGGIIDSSDSSGYFYSCEFSPDSKKLYASGTQRGQIYQYDVSLATAALMRASKKVVSTYPPQNFIPGALQLGPDSNIYIAIGGAQNTLDMIANPNAAAPVYIKNAVANLKGTYTNYSLPQPVPLPDSSVLPGENTKHILQLCLKEPQKIYAPTGISYQWQDGSTGSSFTIKDTGTYWVSLINNCSAYTDTIVVKNFSPQNMLGNDTAMCMGDTIQLKPHVALPGNGTITYTWNTGSTDPFIQVSATGTYSLTVNYMGCMATDKIEIKNVRQPTLVMGNDTTMCYGEKLRLPYLGPIGDTVTYTWSDGSVGSTLLVSQPGVYTLKVTDICERITAGTIKVDFHNCHLYIPNAFTPNSDGLNDKLHLMGDISGVSGFSMRISNRYGQAVYVSEDARAGWDGTYKGQPQPMGVYYYYIKFRNANEEKQLKGDVTLVR